MTKILNKFDALPEVLVLFSLQDAWTSLGEVAFFLEIQLVLNRRCSVDPNGEFEQPKYVLLYSLN